MPRNSKGMGRTGKKHTKKAVDDPPLSQRTKSSDGVSGPSAAGGCDPVDKEAAQT